MIIPAEKGWYAVRNGVPVPVIAWNVETALDGRPIMTPMVPGSHVHGVPSVRPLPNAGPEDFTELRFIPSYYDGAFLPYHYVVPADEKEESAQ